MSRIYVARNVLIGRRVAVKVLAPALATDKANVRRFLNEARAAGSIGHPSIVESLDMGTSSWTASQSRTRSSARGTW